MTMARCLRYALCLAHKTKWSTMTSFFFSHMHFKNVTHKTTSSERIQGLWGSEQKTIDDRRFRFVFVALLCCKHLFCIDVRIDFRMVTVSSNQCVTGNGCYRLEPIFNCQMILSPSYIMGCIELEKKCRVCLLIPVAVSIAEIRISSRHVNSFLYLLHSFLGQIGGFLDLAVERKRQRVNYLKD
jgi:hypothetical protein